MDMGCLAMGGSNGAVMASATSSSFPITYVWSTGVTNIVSSPTTSNTISALPTGIYQVTVTDAGGCVNVGNQTLIATNSAGQ